MRAPRRHLTHRSDTLQAICAERANRCVADECLYRYVEVLATYRDNKLLHTGLRALRISLASGPIFKSIQLHFSPWGQQGPNSLFILNKNSLKQSC